MKQFGLKKEQLETLKNIFLSYDKITDVLLFGSRAKGNFKPGSDVDLALKGNELNLDDILKLRLRIDDTNLPYNIDLILFDNITDQDVIDHIKRVGVSLYNDK